MCDPDKLDEGFCRLDGVSIGIGIESVPDDRFAARRKLGLRSAPHQSANAMSTRTQAWNQSRAYVARTARDEDALTSLLHAVRDDPTPIVNTSRELKMDSFRCLVSSFRQRNACLRWYVV